jgi:hypothetical protein
MSRKRQPIKHGTLGGNRAHYRHKIPMCEPCRQAERDRRGHVRRTLKPCGTDAGYARHAKLREPACAACTEAHRVRQNAYMMARRGDQWPYEQLIPQAARMAADGMTVDAIAFRLHVSKQRVWRALARANRGETA